jgi:hypothetical protein
MRLVLSLLLTLGTLGMLVAAPTRIDRFMLQAPAGERTARIDPEGTTILPNGRC